MGTTTRITGKDIDEIPLADDSDEPEDTMNQIKQRTNSILTIICILAHMLRMLRLTMASTEEENCVPQYYDAQFKPEI
jgi:hypothetical protein